MYKYLSLSRTTLVRWHQKGKAISILMKQEVMGGSGMQVLSPRCWETTTPALHHPDLQVGCFSCCPAKFQST